MDDGRARRVHDQRDDRWRPLGFGVALVLVAVVGLAAFSGGAAAAAPSCAGDGTDFAGGDGSSGTPYEITTVEQLQCMNQTAHLDKDFVLTADVDASDTENWNGGDGFDPIGNDTNRFTGSLDGQDHTISNLTVDRTTENRVGLFGRVGSGGSVANVTLENGTVTGSTYVGGLVGWNGGTVTAVNSTGTVSGDGRVGGLVGNNEGTVTNSSATGNVTGTGDGIGGLVGLNNEDVTNSSATGDVTGENDVGGLVGQSNSGSSIDRSSATGTVEGRGSFVGGLVGNNQGTVAASYTTGDVDGDAISNTFVGGLVGVNGGTVTASYATGTVDGPDNVGGLVGGSSGSVTTSYAIGTVSGNDDVGGLVGVNGGGGTVTDAYWDTQATGQAAGVGSNTATFSAQGLTTAEMTGVNATENMDGFAFTGTWHATKSYPALAWQGTDDPVYGVTVEETTSLDAPHDTFDATVNVTNWGADGGAQTITLTDTDFTDTVQDSESVTLESGESTELTLTWDDSVDDDGDGVVTVASENDAETVTVWPYAGGDGSANNPYEIETWYHLDTVRENRSANYTLVADLDSNTAGYDDVASETANDDAGFDPIGDNANQFTGSLDGQGHTVSNLTVNRSGETYVGLIGYLGAAGSVANVTVNGPVNGSTYVGGLVGWNDGSVTNSSSTGTVSGGTRVGGLVGFNDGTVARAAASAAVDAFDGSETSSLGDAAGGLVGYNRDGSVTNASATGNVTGVEEENGGLVGVNAGDVATSFATGNVTGASDVGGLVGFDDGGTVTNAYWDVNTTNQSTSAGSPNANGLTTVQMTGVSAATNMTGFDFTGTWTVTNDHPALRHFHTHDMAGDGTGGNPFVVTTVDELQAMEDALDVNYELGTDVDASDTATWNGGLGFAPVGIDSNRFTGSLDGQGHTISNLTVNRSSETYVGLIGYLGAAGSVANVTVNGSVNGSAYVGGLVGWNDGSVTNSSTTGTVSGDTRVGGLVGFNDGTVALATASADVTAFADPGGLGDAAGGLVGYNRDGTVTNSSVTGTVTGAEDRVGGLVGRNNGDVGVSFATGNVAGASDVGGLVGFDGGGTVTNSYWDVVTTNQTTSAGGTGLTTTQMQRFAPSTTVTGFDFTSTWNLTVGYPRLQWEGVAAITVDSVDAANATFDEDVNGTITVTANEGGGHAGQGVTVEVTDDGGLGNLSNGNTSVTDADGNATFQFNETTPGSYTPAFAWADNLSVSDTATVTVADATAPTADAGANQTVDEDTQVDFDGSASTDNVGVDSYDWAFDDGATATGATPSHTYDDPGTYTVNLTATDAAGNEGVDSLTVTVNDTTDPTADAGSNQTVDEDTQVDFDASASTDNGVIDTYEWDFGDGTNATGATANYTFDDPGSYTVNLTVTDTGGNNATDALTVTVQEATSGSGGTGVGGGGGGGGGSSDADQFSVALVDGAGSIDLDSLVVSIEVAFTDDSASGTVTVEPSDALPDGTDPLPDAPGLAFVDVTVPPALTDSEATLQLTLDATTLGDVDPADLTIYRYDDGEWTALDTTVVSTPDGAVVIEATTPGFSLFSVGPVIQGSTPTSTPTTSPPKSKASPTTTPSRATSPTPTAPSTETPGQPGFGTGIAVFAFVGATVLAARRRS